jgi:flagellar motor switch protein FliM
MTEVPENRTLTHDKLRRLIELAQQHAAAEDTQQPEVVDYDWSRPHHFSLEQLAALDVFARKSQENITYTFETLCEGPFSLTMKPLSQHFASILAADVTANQPNHYYLPITTEDREHCGFISFPIETASILVALMLREAEKIDGEERKLSILEDSILMDITASIVDSFTEILKKRGGPEIQKTENFITGTWPVDFEGIEDLTTLTYNVECPAGEFEFAFTILSTILEPIVGVEQDFTTKRTKEQINNIIMAHVNKVPVNVTARLSSTAIELDDIMDLKNGDLLLLEQKVSKPFDVLLNDRKCFQAFPATFYGKYALIIAPEESE